MAWQQSKTPDRRMLLIGILASGAVFTLFCFTLLMWFLAPIVGKSILSIPVVTDAPKGMFPDYWFEEKVNPSAKPLNALERKRAKAAIGAALDKYPTILLRMNLNEVHCVSDLQLYGQQHPSGNSTDRVYILNGGVAQGYSDDWLAECLHRELGHIFIRNYGHLFMQVDWRQHLPKGFTYDVDKESEDSAAYDQSSPASVWMEKGFMSSYEAYSLESDFGSIAEGVMTGCSSFYEHLETFPRLRSKAALVVDLYRQLGIETPLWSRFTSSGERSAKTAL